MMRVLELVRYLDSLGIKIWAEAGRLRYKAPKGALTPAIRAELSERKNEILTFLQEAEQSLISKYESIKAIPRDGDMPLSFAQQRLWFLNQLGGQNGTYNIAEALRLTGSINITAMEQAFNEIIRRHEVLRTTFRTVDGQPIQVIAPTLRIPLSVMDLRHLPDDIQEAEVHRLVIDEARYPFDLEHGPLLRVTLVKLGNHSGNEGISSASDAARMAAPPGNPQHVLLVTMHHIVSDGWSLGIFIREFTALYEWFDSSFDGVYPESFDGVYPEPFDFAQDRLRRRAQDRLCRRASPLPELAIQYADFAHWQRTWLTGDVLETQLSYWKQHLAGAPALLELPTDRPRPAVQTFTGNSQRFTIPPALTEQLKQFSQHTGATLFMTLHAAFVALLSRYSGQDDIVVGTPIANRNHQEIEPLIGFFVNTLALRTDLSGDPDVLELLERVRQITLDAYTHQDLPFEQLVEELQPERNLSHHPLFQVMFVLQNAPMEHLKLPGLTLTPLNMEHRIARFDLTLFVEEADQELLGAIEYNTDLFDATTISRMIDHFQILLEGMVTDPTRKVSELPVLTRAEHHQLLVAWNETTVDYPADKCLHHLFEEQVERTPDAIAVVFEDRQLSYHELNARANQLAHYLLSLGIGPEMLVGICMQRSVEMIVGILGILKAGGAYVPIDHAYPKERIAFMLEDSDVKVLLTQEKLKLEPGTWNLDQHDIICLDSDWELIAQESQANPVSGVSPENLCYVIYTSGSTGKPKGTMILHQGVVNYLSWCTKAYAVEGGLGAPVNSSIGFDATVTSLFAPLLTGKTIMLLREENEIEDLADLVYSGKNFSLIKITPAHLKMLAQLAHPETFNSTTRALIIGGEALPYETVSFWRKFSPETRLINEYGPTETVVGCCVYEVSDQSVITDDVPIGRPIANTQLYILDKQLQPAPIGVPGELYIGGAGVARGYLNRPELTGERFIPDPSSAVPGARLYKTGDLARYLPDGTIEFLGRIDYQVKIRGFRVELGEIEAALSAHPDVKDSVVVVRETSPGDKRLVAYIVQNTEYRIQNTEYRIQNTEYRIQNTEYRIQNTEFREYLKQRLPEYMVPAIFVFLEALPLTSNGKVDRKALPEPEHLEIQEGYVGPRHPTEEITASIWAEVLHCQQVGIHDNFFELGGHSLLATQIVSRLRDAFHVALPVRSIFEAPTVAALCKEIESIRWTKESSVISPITSVPRDEHLLLSFAQQRLWFLDQFGGSDSTYNIPTAVRLTGSLNVTAMEQAFNEILRRHEVLRTIFQAVDGQPVQVIAPAEKFPLPVVDLQHVSDDARDAEIQRLTTEEAIKPFDLEYGPLFRVTLLKLGDHSGNEGVSSASDTARIDALPGTPEHILLVTMHHIVSDGWSMGILIREFTALYKAFSEGKPSPLPELSIQYVDFAYWQRSWLTGNVLETQLSYWKKQLKGAPMLLELPTDRSRPAVLTSKGGTQVFTISRELTDKLKKFSQHAEVTLFMTLYTAFVTLLSRYSSQDDIVVGTPVANRNYKEIESLIGFFVNTLALRTDLSGNPDFTEVLDRVKQVTLDAYAYQDIPFEQLVDELHPARNLNYHPLFQVMFVLQNVPAETLKLPGITLTPLEITYNLAKFDLAVSVEETAQGMAGVFEYNTILFDAATITRMIGHFHTLLEGIATNPKQKISELPMLMDAERRQILVKWNATNVEYPDDRCLHHLFEAQVERTPDTVAVVFEGKELTYQELNAGANQLAHHLQAFDVGPDVLVGICVERSIEMVVGLLGILKAGGVYVPMDPSYPKERLAFMLEDSEVKVLLTQEQLKLETGNWKLDHRDIIYLDSDWELIAQESQTNPVSGVSPENLCYVIYTSGSTGKPKGAMIPHRAICNHMLWMQTTFGLSAQDRVFQKTPFSFDASIWEFYAPLLTGGRLIMARPDGHTNSAYMIDVMTKHHVTVLQGVPSLLNMLVADDHFRTCQDLRYVFSGGEALPADLQQHILTTLQGDLYNLYGPTEACIDVTFWKCQHNIRQNIAPIGCPIANTQLYILDKHLQPVPIGIPGELHIGGAGLARGYLNRPELTLEKFIPNPFGDKPGSRLYKTGDLARYLPDGTIEFLGRIDHQIKLRGFRIELGEIEAMLSKHPAVKENAVIVRGNQSDDQQLVAYIVQNAECRMQNSDFCEYLKQQLPEYMIPSFFVFMDSLPLTPNGKIDRKALPDPSRAGKDQETGYVAPCNEAERRLASIWQEVLKTEKVGIWDNFFDLGGHSLKATVMISRVHKELGMEIALWEVFSRPTVEQLAKLIHLKEPSTYTSIERIPNADSYPVSHAQRRLWVLNQMEGGDLAYNMPGAVMLKGHLNRKAFENTFTELIRRHESLRTTFTVSEGELRQKISQSAIHNPQSDVIRFVDLTHEADAAEKAEVLARDDVLQLFDLENGPLFRVSLLKIAEDQHVMIFNLHHIISDGWSMGVLMGEFCRLYDAFARGQENPLPELRIQYRDYAVWQNRMLESEHIGEHQRYWHEKFLGEIPVLNLPTDFPRPAVQTFSGNTIALSFSVEQTEGLRTFSREKGVTLFMTLLATVKVLLYRYTGQEDIIVGTPVAGRNHADLEHQIGFYVNTLALRDQVRGEESFESFLQQIKETTTEAYTHQMYPFDKLVEELELRRDVSRSALFDVMAVMQNFEEPSTVLRTGPTFSANEIDIMPFGEIWKMYPISKFDLTFNFMEAEKELGVIIEYNTDLFREDRIKRMATHFQELTESILKNAAQPVGRLNILPESERHRILYAFNETETEYPYDKTIVELFEDQVEKTPDHPAVVSGNTQLTYRELNERANQIAHFLRSEYRIRPDDRVGLLLERSEQMIAGIMGILKAGGAYVPIEPSYPAERILQIIHDSECKTVLSEPDILKTPLSAQAGGVSDFQGAFKDIYQISHEITTNPDHSVSPHNLAYVIYTSGSTGVPKGVMIEHHSVLNLLTGLYTHIYRYYPPEKLGIALVASYVFDASVQQIFPALLHGHRLVVIDDETKRDGQRLNQLLVEQDIDIADCTPSLLALMAQSEGADRMKTRLKHLIVGGEALPRDLATSICSDEGGVRLSNVYGPTESCVDVTIFSIDASAEFQSSIVPIGKPLPNMQVFILDARLNPVPIGIPGEVCLSGAGLGRGYLNREELTKEKFIPHPFKTGERLYRTGDIGRWLPDGDIEFLGRNDDQVKIRGYRIELGEIENRLLSHESVREAVVLAKSRDNEMSQVKALVAYVTGEPDLNVTTLRDHLKKTLPDYMIPSYFVRVDTFPLTSSGKIDKRALPDPVEAGMEQGTAYQEPRNATESAIASVWGDVLGVEKVGIDDNYFALGGDSIKAIQVLSQLHRQGLKLQIKDIFQHPTVAELAPLAGQAEEILEEQEVSGTVPLTAIQKWFFEEVETARHHFNQAVLLKGKPRFDEKALRTALKALQDHHDALRMQYVMDNGNLTQRYQQTFSGVNLTVVDLRDTDSPFEAMEAHANNLQANIDLEYGPLMKTALYRMEDEDRLLIVIHHLVVDGVSWRILLEDLNLAYLSAQAGGLSLNERPVQLPPKTSSFKTWAEKVYTYSTSSALSEEKAYWQAILSTQVHPLPSDMEDLSAQAGGKNLVRNARTVSVQFSKEETDRILRDVHQAYHTQIDDLLLTGLACALNKWTGECNILILTEGHGRESFDETTDVSRTVGWFTSMYPVLLKLPETEDIGLQIKEIKEILRGIPNKGIGYGILRHIAGDKTLSRSAWPEISYNYLGQFDEDFETAWFSFADESSGDTRSPSQKRFYALDVSGFVLRKELHLSFTYDGTRFRETTMSGLLEEYRQALLDLVEHCLSPEAGGYTPSDFPDIALNWENLNLILEEIGCDHGKPIETIYPLSPSQQGMLFETLAAPDSGVHIEQSVWGLHGELNPAAFEYAWNQLTKRHPVLRTAFSWKALPEPVQIVFQRVDVPIERKDWQGFSPLQQKAELEKYLRNDRRRGFDLNKAPLMRLTIIRLGEYDHISIWTHHHILMDGWSMPLILKELAALYNAYIKGHTLHLEPVRAYREYIAWQRKQDVSQAEAFWRQTLKGLRKPTSLGREWEIRDGACSGQEDNYGKLETRLSASETAALQALVKRRNLSLGTLVQGIWALLLSHYSGETDVVFGATVSGRPPEIPGVESMIGLFINTVPLRFTIAPEVSVWTWLADIQARQSEQRTYEYCATGQVHSWSDVPGSLPLYESILVFENYPVEESIQPISDLNLDLVSHRAEGAQTNYALTLMVSPGAELDLQIVFDRRRFDDADMTWILEHFLDLLKRIIADTDQKIAAVLSEIPADQIPKFVPLRRQDQQIFQEKYLAPRDSLELELTRIWENVLDICPIGVRDNFFELGGHSLVAVRLMAEIGQTFGKHLPLSTLFQGPTVEELAHLLRRTTAISGSPLVAIQPNGPKPPFFCLPGGGGHVIYLYYLAHYLGLDQPFYGLELQGVDEASEPFTRLEDMAAFYVQTLQTIQPQGPYFLGGHSFGALVAFEMAQQLQEQGHEIALLAIIDTEAPVALKESVVDDWDDARWLVNIASDVEALSGKKMDISYDHLRSLEPDEQLLYVTDRLKMINWIPPETEIDQLQRVMQLFKTNTSLASNYVPQKVFHTTRITLFKAQEPPADADYEPSEISKEPAWGWDRFSDKPVEIYEIPGNHFTIVNEPYVRVLAEQLTSCLEKAQVSLIKICRKCILPETFPGVEFDEKGICNYCRAYSEQRKKEDMSLFSDEHELVEYLEKYKNVHEKYDVVVPLSGGVDSSFALITIVEKFKLRPLGFHNDHGYEDEVATNNVRKLCKALNVDLIVWQHDMAFMKKLWKYVNESHVEGMSACYFCGNILYVNALEIADRYQIKLVINGYSKGQAAVIQNVDKARRLMGEMLKVIMPDEEFFQEYMRKNELLSRQKIFQSKQDLIDAVDPEKILVVPFYIFTFYKTDKEALKKECLARFDFQPQKTTYPARTTNCEMIWLNTYMDLKKMRYSIYHDEYSHMIRAGEMTREQALRDLEMNPPKGLLERLAKEIGLDLNMLV
jgi:amino acid adenylation domain-containing protein/non-ribosomal peptide synthase protein (TIGR01720 family)